MDQDTSLSLANMQCILLSRIERKNILPLDAT